MHYKKFIIQNYKGITGPLEINIEKNRLLPIIGVNESGKTTILHAIFAFDHHNDNQNENGRHLKDTANLYTTSSPPATVEAIIHITRQELDSMFTSLTDTDKTLRPELLKLSKLRNRFNQISITRNIATLKYLCNPLSDATADLLCREIVRHLPYILFFDDFRDKIEEKIEIVPQATAAGWLLIIEQLFQQTDPSLSVYTLPSVEERKRKTILAKVQRRLNNTLTKEWQNFRLDDTDALEISITFVGEGVPVRNFLKLEVVETDALGDQHFFFISDRSKGFYWFFNFVMKLEFNPKVVYDDNPLTIYLLDEPGSYLHAYAQRKLCSKLRKLTEMKCRDLLYSFSLSIRPRNNPDK